VIENDVEDEGPTDLWIRPDPPARRPPPPRTPARRIASPHVIRRSEPERAVSGRACMMNLLDDIAAFAAELFVEGKLDRIGAPDIDEEPTHA
jgi:hypothetical protein